MSDDNTNTSAVSAPKPRRKIDLYDLYSGDNLGSIISQPQLRGSNYDEWALNIRLALRARKKFGFADGSIPQPAADSEDLEDWWANNAMVVSWIKLTVAPDLSSPLSHHEIAHDLWLHIQTRFAVKNEQRVQRLNTEIVTCQQRGLAVEAYYGKLTKLWTSLTDFQRARTAAEIAKEREEDKLHQFLMGLDESVFGAVKSSLLSRDTLPTVDKAYQVVTQDEESKHSGRMFEERADAVSFAMQLSNRPPMKTNELRDPNALCTSCGRTGHLADNYFRKIRYPTWWGDRPRSKLPSPGLVVSVGKDGSLPPTAPSRRTGVARVHQAVHTAPATSITTVSNTDRTGISGLSDQQWQALVNLPNERNTNLIDRLSDKPCLES